MGALSCRGLKGETPSSSEDALNLAWVLATVSAMSDGWKR